MLYRVVITGASSGVGEATALAFAEWSRSPAFAAAGRQLALFLTGREEAKLQSVAARALEKAAPGATVHVGVGDVSVVADVKRLHAEMLAAIPTTAAVYDCLVANAGCNRTGLLEELSEEDYDTVMNTNVRGVWAWIVQMLPGMKAAGRGQIIATSSVLGLRVVPRAAVYCASKFALQGLTASLRAEVAGSGIKVATVNPAAIATPWWAEEKRGGRRDAVPNIPMLHPEDVAAAILTIASQSASSDIDKIVLDPATGPQ